MDCISLTKNEVESLKTTCTQFKTTALRVAMNNVIHKSIHSHPQSQCTCGFELFTLVFARLMQSTVPPIQHAHALKHCGVHYI